MDVSPEFFQVLELRLGVRCLYTNESGLSRLPTRLNEALVEVEHHYGERARPIMFQLLVGPMDELFFAEDAPTVHGSIAWPVGEQLYETARRDTFRAAAKSSEMHLPRFGNKGSVVARRYVNGIRMGQTERGSFVVTALVPLDQQDVPGLEQLPVFEDVLGLEDNFLRNVTANLMQASSAAIEAATEFGRTSSFGVFIEAVDYGVSSELVEALSNLATGGRETEISVQWSPLVRDPDNTPQSVQIQPNRASLC